MKAPIREVCCARLPRAALAMLAEIRCAPGVQVALADERAWVRWEAGDEQVLARLLPMSGLELYAHRDGRWYGAGCHLPSFAVPDGLDYRPLHQVLTPAPVEPVPPPLATLQPVRLHLVPDGRWRPTTALQCSVAALAAWADAVPGARLAALRAARCQDRVLLLGPRLPLLPRSERFWGSLVLVPLGCRPEPGLPESSLREGLGCRSDEILILGREGLEVIPRSALQPVTRAGIRMAAGGPG